MPKNLTPLHLVFLALPTFFIRFPLLGFPTNLLDLIIIFTFLLFLWQNKSHLIRIWKPDLINLAALSILLGSTLALTSAIDLAPALGIWKSWILLPLLIFFMLRHTLATSQHPKKLITSLFFSASIPVAILSLWGIFEISTHTFETFDGRLESIFGNANELALLLTPLLAWHLISLFKKTNLTPHLIFIIIFLPTLFLTHSFGAFLALAGAIFISFFILPLKTKTKILTLFLIIIASLPLILFEVNTPKFSQMLDFENRSSTTVRLEIWEVTLNLIKQNPFIGIGPGQFQTNYQTQAPQILNKEPLEQNHPQPHNLLFAFHLQTGLLGLLGFLTLIFMIIKNTFKNHTHPCIIPILASFLVIFFHGFIDTPFWRADLALLFWLILASLFVLTHPKETSK